MYVLKNPVASILVLGSNWVANIYSIFYIENLCIGVEFAALIRERCTAGAS